MPRLLCQSARSGSSSRLRSISATASLAPPLLMGEHAGVVQGVGMVGRDLEDPAIDVARGRPLLVLLELDRDRDRFVEADGAVLRRRLLHSCVHPPRTSRGS